MAENDKNLEEKLFAAVEGNDKAKVEELIKQGVNVNTRDINGDTVLIIAARLGLGEIVDCLLDNGADVNEKDKEGWTALMKTDNRRIAESLIKHGADVNAKDKDGWTALMIAALIGRFDIVKYLVDLGVDLNKKNNMGETALMLFIMSQNYNSDTAKYFIKHGADPNATDIHGDNVLMHFVKWRDDLAFVKYLVDLGVDPNKKNKYGLSVRDYADENKPEIAKYLDEQSKTQT
jgi:ankyrin repeat protein